VVVANQRLSLLFREFVDAGVKFEKRFFELRPAAGIPNERCGVA